MPGVVVSEVTTELEGAATADSTSLVLNDPYSADPKVVALAGFQAGYVARTRAQAGRLQSIHLYEGAGPPTSKVAPPLVRGCLTVDRGADLFRLVSYLRNARASHRTATGTAMAWRFEGMGELSNTICVVRRCRRNPGSCTERHRCCHQRTCCEEADPSPHAVPDVHVILFSGCCDLRDRLWLVTT